MMHKHFFLILFLLVGISICPALGENSVSIVNDDYEYEILEDGTAAILKCKMDKATNIIIPEAIDGHSLSAIGDDAFNGCSQLIEITIPKNINKIGSNPWEGCKNLASIIVSDKHPYFSMLDGALYSRTEKKLICYPRACNESKYNIPDGVEILGEKSFFYCTNLEIITVPNSVNLIGASAFYGCKNLKSINIPESVTSIEAYTFAACQSLSEISIPENTKYIGDHAFNGCDKLISFNIPDNVKKVGINPWSNCDSLISINISPDHPCLMVENDILYSKVEGCLICCPYSLVITSINIPDGISTIGKNSFANNDNLVDLNISGNITIIDEFAFGNCRNLTNIKIPNSVTTIGDNAFCLCEKLSGFNIPNNVTLIGEEVFSFCKEITRVNIPDNVSSIGENVFRNCKKLKTIIVGRNSLGEKYCIENKLPYTYSNTQKYENSPATSINPSESTKHEPSKIDEILNDINSFLAPFIEAESKYSPDHPSQSKVWYDEVNNTFVILRTSQLSMDIFSLIKDDGNSYVEEHFDLLEQMVHNINFVADYCATLCINDPSSLLYAIVDRLPVLDEVDNNSILFSVFIPDCDNVGFDSAIIYDSLGIYTTRK